MWEARDSVQEVWSLSNEIWSNLGLHKYLTSGTPFVNEWITYYEDEWNESETTTRGTIHGCDVISEWILWGETIVTEMTKIENKINLILEGM